MSHFYAKAEDEERCLQSSTNQRPVMVTGLTTEGKMASFGGIVQSVESNNFVIIRQLEHHPLSFLARMRDLIFQPIQ